MKPPAGGMTLYPSSSLHKVEPATHGARACSYFWLQSMVADHGRRTLLVERDGANPETARTDR